MTIFDCKEPESAVDFTFNKSWVEVAPAFTLHLTLQKCNKDTKTNMHYP